MHVVAIVYVNYLLVAATCIPLLQMQQNALQCIRVHLSNFFQLRLISEFDLQSAFCRRGCCSLARCYCYCDTLPKGIMHLLSEIFSSHKKAFTIPSIIRGDLKTIISFRLCVICCQNKQWNILKTANENGVF